MLDILNYVHNQIPNEIKLEFERRKIQRVEKFEKIVEKLKAEVK